MEIHNIHELWVNVETNRISSAHQPSKQRGTGTSERIHHKERRLHVFTCLKQIKPTHTRPKQYRLLLRSIDLGLAELNRPAKGKQHLLQNLDADLFVSEPHLTAKH